MYIIVKELEIIGDKKRSMVRSLFDSGASDLVLREHIAEGAASFSRLSESANLLPGCGKRTVTSEYFTGIGSVLEECTFPAQRVLIVDELDDERILRGDAFQRWKRELHFEHGDVLFDRSALKVKCV